MLSREDDGPTWRDRGGARRQTTETAPPTIAATPAPTPENRIIHQMPGYQGNSGCQDRLTVCPRYKSLGFCTHEYYKWYMYSNCAATCQKCMCKSWSEVPLGDPRPVASCRTCCSEVHTPLLTALYDANLTLKLSASTLRHYSAPFHNFTLFAGLGVSTERPVGRGEVHTVKASPVGRTWSFLRSRLSL